MQRRAKICTAGVFTVVLLGGISSAARADLKIVSEVTIGGVKQVAAAATASAATTSSAPSTSPTQSSASTLPKKVVYTTLVKGLKARRESPESGGIVIYDRDDDKVFTLDQTAHTYYVRSFKDARKAGENLPDAMDKRFDLKTDVSLDESDSGNAASAKGNVAGADTESLFLTGSFSLSLKQSDGGGRSGGGGGVFGGGFPGGGGGGGRRRGGGGGGRRPSEGNRAPMPRVSIEGDFQVTGAEKLLPEGGKYEQDLTLALVEQALPEDDYPILDDLSDQLGKKKVLPLSAHLTIRRETPRPVSDEYSTSSDTPPPPPLEIRMEVRSIDTAAKLDDALFKVPSDYTKIDPPDPKSPFPVP